MEMFQRRNKRVTKGPDPSPRRIGPSARLRDAPVRCALSRLRRVVEYDDWQVRLPLEALDHESQPLHRTYDARACPGVGVSGARFKRDDGFGAIAIKSIDGYGAVDAGMHALSVVPADVRPNQRIELDSIRRCSDDGEEFGFQRAEKTFDDGDGTVLSKRPFAMPNALFAAPVAELISKLHALVGHDVLRSATGSYDRLLEQLDDLPCGRVSSKRSDRHHGPRVLIDDCHDVPSKRPDDRQRPRHPRYPEAGGRDGCDIDVVNVMRVVRDDGATGFDGRSRRRGRQLWRRDRFLTCDVSDGAGSDGEPGAGKRLSDLLATHERERRSHLLHDESHEVGEAIGRKARLDERLLAVPLQTSDPVSDGARRYEERLSGSLDAPPARRSQKQDREAFWY